MWGKILVDSEIWQRRKVRIFPVFKTFKWFLIPEQAKQLENAIWKLS